MSVQLCVGKSIAGDTLTSTLVNRVGDHYHGARVNLMCSKSTYSNCPSGNPAGFSLPELLV